MTTIPVDATKPTRYEPGIYAPLGVKWHQLAKLAKTPVADGQLAAMQRLQFKPSSSYLQMVGTVKQLLGRDPTFTTADVVPLHDTIKKIWSGTKAAGAKHPVTRDVSMYGFVLAQLQHRMYVGELIRNIAAAMVDVIQHRQTVGEKLAESLFDQLKRSVTVAASSDSPELYDITLGYVPDAAHGIRPSCWCR